MARITSPKRRNLVALRQGLVEVDRLLVLYPTAPPSLNANWKPNNNGGFRRDEAYERWRDGAGYMLNHSCRAYIAGPFYAFIRVGGGASAADVDNLIKPALDVLVTNGRVDDDRRNRMLGVASRAVEGNRFVLELGAPHHLRAMVERWLEGN